MFRSFWRIGLVLDEDPPVGCSDCLLADFQHLLQVLAGLDLLPELGVLRELMRQRLIEQMLQGFPEVRTHGTLQDERREQRLEVRLRHVVGGVERARRRLGSDGKRRLDRLEQPLRQGTLLILEQQPGGLPILQRQVLGILIEVVAPEQQVDDDQLAQVPPGSGWRRTRGARPASAAARSSPGTC